MHDASSSPAPYLSGPATFIAHYVRRRAGTFLLLLTLVVGAAGAAVGVQYVMKLLVDAMTNGGGDKSAIWNPLGLFLALVAGESLAWRAVGWLTCRTTVGIGVDMRLDLFDFLNKQPMRYFADNLAGSLGQRITSTAGNFGALVNTLVWRVMPPCIDFLGALIIFSQVDPGLTIALAILVTCVTGVLLWFGERGRPRHRLYSGQASQVAGELTDTITNMWAVKAFSARAREAGRLGQLFGAEAALQRASWMHIEKARLLHDAVLWVTTAIVLGWAISLWSNGRITPGDVVVVSTLTFRILHGSRDLALALVDVAQQFGFIDETLRTIGQPPTVLDAPDARPLVARGGRIEFRKVSFHYPGASDAVHELDLTIEAGQKVGIVGPSGAGKSTLIHLMQRLYDVQHGQILIDGQPIIEVTQDSLRDALAVVPQEINLFHRSVIDNIRFGRPEATDEEVRAAARAAHCDEFVSRLSQGYDTIVGERGTRLSGGQRQRIGIARAFLKDAPIIVFDEATSALDTESEIEIQRALVGLMKGRTVIAVAHRLSTLASFDRVLVVMNGRIVEDGSPTALRRRNGLFETMWRMQAAGLSLDVLEDAA